jgi:hypothetical protein
MTKSQVWVRRRGPTTPVPLECLPTTFGRLKRAIKNHFGLSCDSTRIAIEGYVKKNEWDEVKPCEPKGACVFFEMECWVQGEADSYSKRLETFPATLGQLKDAIKAQFKLPCDSTVIVFPDHAEKKDWDSVKPCDSTIPYVYTAPQIWVQPFGPSAGVTMRLDTVPGTLRQLKHAIKVQYGLSCDVTRIRVEDYADMDWQDVKTCQKTNPYRFRELQCWVQRRGYRPMKLEGFPNTFFKLRQSIKAVR